MVSRWRSWVSDAWVRDGASGRIFVLKGLHVFRMDQKIRRILLVSYYLPSRAHGGGLRLLDLYGLIRRVFPQARIDLAACRQTVGEEVEGLQEIFDNIYLLEPDRFSPEGFRFAGLLDGQYDVVDLQYLQSGRFIRVFRRRGTERIIFSPMESMVRATAILFSDLISSFSLRKLARLSEYLRYSAREIGYVLRADRVLCVSEKDASTLKMFRRRGGVFAIETGVSPLEFPRSLGPLPPARNFGEIKNVVFVAFFGSLTNRDALTWYLREVHPVVTAAIPSYRFQIVGRGLEEPFFAPDGNIDVIGAVDSIEDQLEGAWVGIAPALSGAGLRGKINQYAIAGVPCVASELAADGFAYSDGESICLANDAAEFAQQCIALLSSREYNKTVGEAARRVCLANYVWDVKIDQVSNVFDLAP
jgi:glycosyltransferase involved in cell wall biosynthesis